MTTNPKDCIFFWDGPFSQWYPSEFMFNGVVFNCAEQFMMASKAAMFDDKATYDLIMQARSPRRQKEFGRQVKGFDKDEWEYQCQEIVAFGNVLKFSQNSELLDILINTGDKIIVEASPYDKIWGIGISVERAEAGEPWRGTNWLGEAIMKARNSLKSLNK